MLICPLPPSWHPPPQPQAPAPSCCIPPTHPGQGAAGGDGVRVTDVGGLTPPTPPRKSRSRREQGSPPITRLGGDADPPPWRDEAAKDLAKEHGQGQAGQQWQGWQPPIPWRCDHAQAPKKEERQSEKIYFKGR